MKKRWLGAAATLALCAGALTAPTFADDSTQDKLNQARQNEQQTASSIAGIEAQLAQLNAQANELAAQLAEKEAKQLEAQQELDAAAGEVANAGMALEAAQSGVDAARKDLGKISTAMYREGAGSLSQAASLFNSSSVSEVNDRAHAYKMLGAGAEQSVQKYEASTDVANTLSEAAKKKQEIVAQKLQEAEAATKAVADIKAQIDQQKASADSQREELVQKLAEQKGTTAELERQLQAEQEAERQRQLEERRRQEQARIQAAAQAAAQRQQAAQQAAQQSQQTYQPSTPVYVAPPAQTGASGLGGQLAASAAAYVGRVPYVWGGKGPGGWDCSGFVAWISAQYGIYIPSYTESILAKGVAEGREIPASQAQPGDILYWPGHVAFSNGGTNTIEALNPNMGTVYGKTYWHGPARAFRFW